MNTLFLKPGARVAGSQGFRPSRRGLSRLLKGPCVFAVVLVLGLTLVSGCGDGGLTVSSGSSGSGSGGNNSGGSGSGGNDSGGVGSGGSSSGSGGNDSGGVGSGGGGGSGATVLVSLGQFATVPDQGVSFKITIDSVALHSSHGDIPLLSRPRRVEISRFKAEALWLDKAPEGDYSGIVIGVSNPEISFFDSSGVLHENVAASLTSSSATNASEFGLGSNPREISLNLRFFNTNFDGGVVKMTPGLDINTQSLWPEELVGRITNVGSGSFTMDAGNSAFTFATDSGTEFQNFTALSELSAGMTVEVGAVLDSGGTFRATKVKLESDDASEVVVEGPVRSLSPEDFDMLVREVHGPGIEGVTMASAGRTGTSERNASTQYRIEADDVDLTHLDFTPTFDALTITPGQNVRASLNGGGAWYPLADHLKLEAQSIVGTAGAVTAGAVSEQYSFPLNLAPDSAFAQMTGHTSVLVTLQPSTTKYLYFGQEDCVTCITGGPARVRGLLFFSGGQYHLVAKQVAVD